MLPSEVQRLIDGQPDDARVAALEGALPPSDSKLSQDLRAPAWWNFGLRRDLTKALARAAERPFQLTERRVIGVPVWISRTEDDPGREVTLSLALFEPDGEWMREVRVDPDSALWFAGRLRGVGRNLLMPSHSYAPEVPTEGRFGPYAVVFSELAWELTDLEHGARVSILKAPEGDLDPWHCDAQLAMRWIDLPREHHAVVRTVLDRILARE